MQTSTKRVQCRGGDHLVEVRDREEVARRLLETSRRHAYDPDVDVDWTAELPDGAFYGPPHLVSLYETPLWDRMSHRQRVDLSRHEVCSVAAFGITAELMLMNGLIGHAATRRYETAHWAYALTEVEDECRHSRMFARMIETFGVTPVRPARWQQWMARTTALLNDPMRLFAGALVVEEFTDAFQRVTMADESVHPVTRQVSRIHVLEEARHIRYAREELKRQVTRRSELNRKLGGYGLARLTRLLVATAVHPSCYTAVGLDPREARLAAAHSPHRRQIERWALAKCVRFFGEVGYLDGPARGAWVRTGLLAPANF